MSVREYFYQKLFEKLNANYNLDPDTIRVGIPVSENNRLVKYKKKYYLIEGEAIVGIFSTLEEVAASIVIRELETTDIGRHVLLYIVASEYPVARTWAEYACTYVRWSTGMSPEEWLSRRWQETKERLLTLVRRRPQEREKRSPKDVEQVPHSYHHHEDPVEQHYQLSGAVTQEPPDKSLNQSHASAT